MTDQGEEHNLAVNLAFKATNNEPEYDFHIQQVPRRENQEAERLAKATPGQEELPLLEHTMVKTVNS